MKPKLPPLDIDKEVQELKKKLKIIEAEDEFWQEIDDEVQKRAKKGICTKND